MTELLFSTHGFKGKITEKREGSKKLFIKLKGVSDRITWFTDIPDRSAGNQHFDEFIRLWDEKYFADGTDPNAALEYENEYGNSDVVVFEMQKPKYNKKKDILKFEARIDKDQVLEGPFQRHLVHADNDFKERLKRPSLFIDNAVGDGFTEVPSVTIANNLNIPIMLHPIGFAKDGKSTFDYLKDIASDSLDYLGSVYTDASDYISDNPATIAAVGAATGFAKVIPSIDLGLPIVYSPTLPAAFDAGLEIEMEEALLSGLMRRSASAATDETLIIGGSNDLAIISEEASVLSESVVSSAAEESFLSESVANTISTIGDSSISIANNIDGIFMLASEEEAAILAAEEAATISLSTVAGATLLAAVAVTAAADAYTTNYRTVIDKEQEPQIIMPGESIVVAGRDSRWGFSNGVADVAFKLTTQPYIDSVTGMVTSSILGSAFFDNPYVGDTWAKISPAQADSKALPIPRSINDIESIKMNPNSNYVTKEFDGGRFDVQRHDDYGFGKNGYKIWRLEINPENQNDCSGSCEAFTYEEPWGTNWF